MAVTTGEDGKIHYINERKRIRDMKYESYGHWYDEGPGSESFKRKLREKTAAWPSWKKKAAKTSVGKNYDKESKMLKELREAFDHVKEPKEYITDKDLEIDV